MNRFVMPSHRILVPALLSALFATVSLGVLPAEAQQAKKKQAAAKKEPAKADTKATGGAQTFLIGTFGDWKALTTGKDKAKVCYALAQPNQRLPAKLNRDPGYLFISSRMADGARNEIAFKLGFSPKAGQEGQLQIGSTNFTVIGSGESAFLKNPAQEGQVLDTMKKAATVTIKITSARGNDTSDRYSMNGLTKALEAVAKECP
ncbi:MAG TPA: hypothetical protein PKW21_04115 [Rhabdaerophilum sp.]|nr:hypothetical protein [Rhabdaerophilum sp.]